nr:PREDICTED: uncharacterized protein LOC104153484 [Struthio camelus australis]
MLLPQGILKQQKPSGKQSIRKGLCATSPGPFDAPCSGFHDEPNRRQYWAGENIMVANTQFPAAQQWQTGKRRKERRLIFQVGTKGRQEHTSTLSDTSYTEVTQRSIRMRKRWPPKKSLEAIRHLTSIANDTATPLHCVRDSLSLAILCQENEMNVTPKLIPLEMKIEVPGSIAATEECHELWEKSRSMEGPSRHHLRPPEVRKQFAEVLQANSVGLLDSTRDTETSVPEHRGKQRDTKTSHMHTADPKGATVPRLPFHFEAANRFAYSTARKQRPASESGFVITRIFHAYISPMMKYSLSVARSCREFPRDCCVPRHLRKEHHDCLPARCHRAALSKHGV